MKRIAVIYGALAMFLAPVAMAADQPRPSEIAQAVKSETPYGTGKLSRLMITAYDAALWTDAKQWSYDSTFALSLRYHMAFTTQELVDRTISEMRGQGDVSAEDETAYRAQLSKVFPNVKDGDRITALYVAPRTTRFYYNGTPKGDVSDAVFAKRFFDIWLSERTSEPSLRKSLLPSNE